MLGNIFILGDSYSTFEGYIPDGYSAYYKKDGPCYIEQNPGMELNDNDVIKVEHTWWYNLTHENGTLIKNCSWSGTTICNTGYDGNDNSDISFIGRMQKLLDEKYFEKNRVDTFFVFGGTNDYWADAPLGKEIKSGWSTADLYKVFPAFSYLMNMLVSEFPDAKIYCIINTDLKPEITKFYKTVCKENDVDIIELYNIDKVYGHPTIKGMQEIKNQIFDYMGLK